MEQVDISGKKFNRLTGVKYSHKKGNRLHWVFKCGCGTIKIIDKSCVVTGVVKSCGCLAREAHAIHAKKYFSTHNMANTKFYKMWKSMKKRATNPAKTHKKHYNNVSISKEWMDFEIFKTDMYDRYLKHWIIFGGRNTTLDRIDNSMGYSKENCRWTTYYMQNRNKGNNIRFTHNDETMLLKDWCVKQRLRYETVRQRISRGKSTMEALELCK